MTTIHAYCQRWIRLNGLGRNPICAFVTCFHKWPPSLIVVFHTWSHSRMFLKPFDGINFSATWSFARHQTQLGFLDMRNTNRLFFFASMTALNVRMLRTKVTIRLTVIHSPAIRCIFPLPSPFPIVTIFSVLHLSSFHNLDSC